MSERIAVSLSGDLLKRAKRHAAAEGRSVTALIQEGLQLRLASGSAQRKTKRKLPPASTATGGLMPGIDLDAKEL
jgi:hypothetical protein